jgi:hypothetical protein
MRNPNPKAFGVNALVRRGWNRSLIAKVLGAEDFTALNRQFPGRDDRPMRLFSRSRVEAAERGEAFCRMLQRRRRKAAKGSRYAQSSE